MNGLNGQRSANPENNVKSPVTCLILSQELHKIRSETDGKFGVQYRIVGISDMESKSSVVGSATPYPIVTTEVKAGFRFFGIIDGDGNSSSFTSQTGRDNGSGYSMIAVLTYGPVTVLRSCVLTAKTEKLVTQMALYVAPHPDTNRWALASEQYINSNPPASRAVVSLDSIKNFVQTLVTAFRTLKTVCATVEKHMDDGDYVTVLLCNEM